MKRILSIVVICLSMFFPALQAQAKTERVKVPAGKTQIIGYAAITTGVNTCAFSKFKSFFVSKQPKNGKVTVTLERINIQQGSCKGATASVHVIRYKGNGKSDRVTVGFTGDAFDDPSGEKTWYNKYKIN